MVLIIVTALAIGAGFLLPLRWGVLGFALATSLLFLLQVGIHTAQGFEGTSLEESLLLFNGSWISFLGFNAQITYRAFFIPVVSLAALFIFRLQRRG